MDESIRFQKELLCIHCGYNLSGLESEGRCPECGAALRHAEAGNRLAAADADWLGHLARGQRKITAAVITFVLFAVWANVLKSFLSPSAFDLSFPIAKLVCHVWLLIGVLEITRQDPRLTLVEAGMNARIFSRVGAVLALCLAPISGGIPSLLRDSPATLQVVGIAYAVALLLTVAVVTVYLSELALRIPNKRLAETTRHMGIRLGVTAVIFLVGRQVVPGGPIVQLFDRSIILGSLKVLNGLFGFATACYFFRVAQLWWSFRRILGALASPTDPDEAVGQ